MAQSDPSDAAVRNYLLYLEDPATVIDHQLVQKMELAVQTAVDPLVKLKAVTALERAKQGDETSLRDGFVQHAKAWAERNGIPASSFEQLGVGADLLRKAGLITGRPRSGARGAATTKARKSVTAEQIKAALATRTTEFTLAEVASTVGGSPMTIRKAVDELVRSGSVTRLGPTPNWTHQGRAPILFRPASRKRVAAK